MLITLVTWLALPKLTELKEYAPLFTLISILYSMALTGWAKWYTWREKCRREKKEIEDKQIVQVVQGEMRKANEEKSNMLSTILDNTNGRYVALERKLEIETAKNTDLAVKLLESESENTVLEQLLAKRRKNRKVKQ